MIKKLRKKFILINMAFILPIFLLVFGVICYTNYDKYEKDSQSALTRELNGRENEKMPQLSMNSRPHKEEFNLFPIFVVRIDHDGKVSILKENNLSVTDDFANEMAAKVMNSSKDKGLLKSANLRYLKQKTPDGTKIAFADRTEEMNSMMVLIRNCVLIYFACVAAFLGISIFLARWALNPVEKAWEQQRQFLADASHELKTPLTVILANLDILYTHKEDSIVHQLKWLMNTKEEAARMKELVESLLYLARYDANSFGTERKEIDVSDALWSSLLPFESVAYEKNITMEESIVPNLRLVGDESQLKRLFAILLDNACKYADSAGEVRILLYEKQDRIVLTVANTGEPIAEEELPHLFERFYRADKARKAGGYGLGLAIAWSIVEKHHGRIKAESRAEAGTVFTVTLPSAVNAAAAGNNESQQKISSPDRKIM